MVSKISLLNIVNQEKTAAAALAEAVELYPDSIIGTDNGYGIPIQTIVNFLPVDGLIDTTGRVGTAGDDLLLGSKYINIMAGYGGNDWFKGYGGDDVLDGGRGDDILDGGRGNDKMAGGAGDDVFVFGLNSGKDRVNGFVCGEDKIDVSAYRFESGVNVLYNTAINEDGDYVIRLSAFNSLILHNVNGHLSQADFIV